MKRRILIYIIFYFMVSAISSEEIVLYLGDGFVYNEFLGGLTDTNFVIKYDTENDIYFFVTKDFIKTGFVFLTEQDIEKIRKNIEKYLEWEKIAVDKQVKIEKQLPDSSITRKVGFWYGDEWYFANNLTMNFSFFSQTEDRHQLLISSNKVDSTKNEYIDYKIETLYLDRNQIISFSDGISSDAINIKLLDYKKQQETESMFN